MLSLRGLRRYPPDGGRKERGGTEPPQETSVGRPDSRLPHRKSEDIGTRVIRRSVAGSVRRGRASQASTWKLRAVPRRHHSQKCSQLLVNSPIAVFPNTGSCSADNLSNVEIGWRVRSHPDALSVREMSERNFFQRPSAQTMREPRVVNDLARTYVDAVMQIAAGANTGSLATPMRN
jgi:hypothetical protein